MNLIQRILRQRQKVLSEHDSKELLRHYGLPVAKELEIHDQQELLESIQELGFPIVMKACQPGLSHKTEQNLVLIDIRTEQEAITAFESLMEHSTAEVRSVLVAERVFGHRELMAGLMTDPQFGPCLMFGLGGIFTEMLADVVFRTVPISRKDGFDMIAEIRCQKLLDGFRGMPGIDKGQLVDILIKLNQMCMDHEVIQEIDVNPIILSHEGPSIVDALVILKEK